MRILVFCLLIVTSVRAQQRPPEEALLFNDKLTGQDRPLLWVLVNVNGKHIDRSATIAFRFAYGTVRSVVTGRGETIIGDSMDYRITPDCNIETSYKQGHIILRELWTVKSITAKELVIVDSAGRVKTFRAAVLGK